MMATAAATGASVDRDTDLDADLDQVAGKVVDGVRLTRDDGLALLRTDDLSLLGELATLVRNRKHPDRVVTYIVDRNINPTNVCVARCSFCAFDRLPGDPEGYVLTNEQLFTKVDELLAVPGVDAALIARGGVQVLLQGGHHPKLGIDYYEALFRTLRALPEAPSARPFAVRDRPRLEAVAALDPRGGRAVEAGRVEQHPGWRRRDPGRPRAA